MIDTKPMVSVIIPTYNRLAYLKQAVNSCLEQTYVRVEIIVVDDGSTDDTESSVRALIDGPWQGKVEYCKQDNAGASAARNRGLKLARGEYVQFLDSDDLLLPEKISLQVEVLKEAGAATEVCSCYGLSGGFDEDLASMRRICIHCDQPVDYVRAMAKGGIHAMQTSAPLWRRDFLLSQDGWREDISLGDDREYHVRLLSKCSTILFVDAPLYVLREHSGPRLSDAEANLPRLMSAFSALRSVVSVVQNLGEWDSEVYDGVVRSAKTLYVNLLQCGCADSLVEFEQWIASITQFDSSAKSSFRLLLAMFWGRKLFGVRFVRAVFVMLMSIRKSLS